MEWNPGFPLSIDAKCHKDLPRDIQFDSEKGVDFVLNYSKAYVCDSLSSWGRRRDSHSSPRGGLGLREQLC